MKYIILNSFKATPLHQKLRELKIRQYDLAKTLGISQSYLSKMLRGIEPFRQEYIDKINQILKTVRERNKPKLIRHK